MRTWLQTIGLVWLFGGPGGIAAVSAGELEAARACTGEPLRLARLACFDEAFGTPVTAARMVTEPEEARSEPWRQAYARAGDPSVTPSVYFRDTGSSAGLLVTIPALATAPPRPLLTLQCHNNITELALMLPEPLNAERVRLGFDEAGSSWRVRDSGYVVSAGRGLPAIQAARSLLSANAVRLVASRTEIDGLLFDLTGLAKAVAPLRASCGW